jgi:hypothetical protein
MSLAIKASSRLTDKGVLREDVGVPKKFIMSFVTVLALTATGPLSPTISSLAVENMHNSDRTPDGHRCKVPREGCDAAKMRGRPLALLAFQAPTVVVVTTKAKESLTIV